MFMNPSCLYMLFRQQCIFQNLTNYNSIFTASISPDKFHPSVLWGLGVSEVDNIKKHAMNFTGVKVVFLFPILPAWYWQRKLEGKTQKKQRRMQEKRTECQKESEDKGRELIGSEY